MSQTVITQAFEALKAQEAANGGVLTLDEFVFASVPNLNITDPIDRAEGLPPEAQIVHRQAVSKTGMVNSNAVVYSVVLGADVGDFEFNWVGLLNKASGVVAMIVHAPSQKKIRTQSGQQGNVLTRSFLMEYNGASTQTNITTPADTWQIDFTARLNGVDERIRLENIDTYGVASFLKDGFLVSGANGSYQVKKGAAYIEGLRAELLFDQTLAVATRPSKIWVDVCWRGTMTSIWATATKITVAETLESYVTGDEQHYVFAIADVLADGTVVDLRQASSLAQMAGLSAEPDVVPYFDKDSLLKMSAVSDFGRDILAVPDLEGALSKLGLDDRPEIKSVTWKGFSGGADPTGVKSSVPALKSAFEYGGDIHIPEGNYFIPNEGTDAGGVLATLTKSLNVMCSPRAKFFTDGVDNDMIRLEMPLDGVGLPDEGITIDWDGGFFDQRNQKGSVTMPFITEYPPAHPGKSPTCDGLSIRGDYTVGGVVKSGVTRATVSRVVTLAGQHWQSAGGDSGIFIGGVLEQHVERCYLKGNRDLGIYLSADESGTLKCSATATGNILDTCFHGSSLKRGFESAKIFANTFRNCVRGAQSEFLAVRNKAVDVCNNTFTSCGITVRYQQTDGGVISGNSDYNHGAMLSNGAIEPIIGLRGYLLESCVGVTVESNNAFPENPLSVTAYPGGGFGVNIAPGSSNCLIRDNLFKGWRRLGSDETIGGKNRWKGNSCPDGTAKSVTFTDVNGGSEERVADLLGNNPWIRTPTYVFLTDEETPLIRGYASGATASNAGIYFKGPDIGLAGPNVLIQGSLYPVTANNTALGAATSPLSGGFTQSAFSVTSDDTHKPIQELITDKLLDAWSEVNWCMFKLKDRIEAKGVDGARWHFGVIAQRVHEAFARHGLDGFEYGLICYDQWDYKPAEYRNLAQEEIDSGIYPLMQTKILVSEEVQAGDKWGIRYEEALVIEAAFQRRKYEQLSSRIEAIEARISSDQKGL
ncbi:hypothetical protein C3387_09895 [Leclercia sp. LSNIH6]|nr:hypothetical protein C3370_05985 [Leclercia sp. LSNIH7]POU78437.1 hypothetical protein C3387_09895 [Leclercia sp. LSNIH6]POW53182.1 hypothetical protein C3406_07140 [Leclercia sp. LSNIH8]